jgi:hypothetical protein
LYDCPEGFLTKWNGLPWIIYGLSVAGIAVGWGFLWKIVSGLSSKNGAFLYFRLKTIIGVFKKPQPEKIPSTYCYGNRSFLRLSLG